MGKTNTEITKIVRMEASLAATIRLSYLPFVRLLFSFNVNDNNYLLVLCAPSSMKEKTLINILQSALLIQCDVSYPQI